MAYRCGDCVMCLVPGIAFEKRLTSPMVDDIGFCIDLEKFVLESDSPLDHHCNDLPEDWT